MGKKIVKKVKELFENFFDIVYPPEEKCIICRAEDFIGICDLCRSKIKRIEKQGDILSYGFYGGVLKELILSFKYKKNFTSGKILSQLLIELIKEENIDFDIICYVPMTKKSIKKRGFNQCEIIAKNISKDINIPISRCIFKVKNTEEQKTLSKDERVKNVKGAFLIKNKSDIYKKKILLVDDVITTGSTLLECKKILEKSGVERINILTIAKSHI